MADLHEGELEMELEEEFHEGELESEEESSLEGEGWLGAIGNVVGSLLGEGEEELEGEGWFGRLVAKAAKAAAPLVSASISGGDDTAPGDGASEGEYEE